MTWQIELCIAPETHREIFDSFVAVATSKHVSAAVVNAGGSGHVIGDVITISHASGYHPFRLEVTAVSAGAITEFRINTGGAFAERVATAAINVGGTGYAVDDVLAVQGGSANQKAKVQVTTVSAGVITGVAVFETGGSYSTAPGLTGAATIGVGPGAFAGDDAATVNITMQAIIGTTAIAQSSTTGSGTGATFDLTLTDTGWTTLMDRNGVLTDGRDTEKEVVLQGTVAGADAPIVGMISVRTDNGGQKRWGFALFGMLAYNPGFIDTMANQPGVGPEPWIGNINLGAHVLITEEIDEKNSWWVSITPRRICGVIRGNILAEADSYHSFYVGLGNGYGPTTTSPYPMLVIGSSNNIARRTSDFNSTGLAEMHQQTPSTTGPGFYLRKSDLLWVTIVNDFDGSKRDDEVMWPRGQIQEASGADNVVLNDYYRHFIDGVIGSINRSNITGKIFPAPGSPVGFTPMPLTVISSGGGGAQTPNTTIVAELDGCFFVGTVNGSGTVFQPEDFLGGTGVRYRIFPCSTESITNRGYQFFAIRED